MLLTPEACAAVYDCLRQFRPFRGWNLPPAEQVEFCITRDRKNFGATTHYIGTDQHIIEISAVNNGHFTTVASTMAHEMVHLHQRRARLCTKAQHNADFWRRAKSVCREFGWDPKAF